MTFTLSAVARSLAETMAPVLPGVAFYEDPNQQDSQMPAPFSSSGTLTLNCVRGSAGCGGLGWT